MSMKIGERGQVTIPKRLRERLGLRPGSEVEFRVEGNRLVLGKKAPFTAALARYHGRGREQLRRLGVRDVDQLIELLRGR